jgi:hypothetical protein
MHISDELLHEAVAAMDGIRRTTCATSTRS